MVSSLLQLLWLLLSPLPGQVLLTLASPSLPAPFRVLTGARALFLSQLLAHALSPLVIFRSQLDLSRTLFQPTP